MMPVTISIWRKGRFVPVPATQLRAWPLRRMSNGRHVVVAEDEDDAQAILARRLGMGRRRNPDENEELEGYGWRVVS